MEGLGFPLLLVRKAYKMAKASKYDTLKVMLGYLIVPEVTLPNQIEVQVGITMFPSLSFALATK